MPKEKPPYVIEFETLAAARQAIELPMQYLPILGALVTDPGATVKRLCAISDMDVDAMSRTLKVLRVDHKLVDFEPHPTDARSKQFFLTPRGLEQAIKWLKARGITLTEEQVQSIPVIMPEKKRQSRVRGGPAEES